MDNNFDKLNMEAEKEIFAGTQRKIESVAEILKKEVKEEPFILQKMIPENAITALTADVGKGKSLFMLKIAQAIATGEKLFDTYGTKKAKILILDLEMSENDIISRVHSVIQEPADMFFHYQNFQIDNPADYDWLVKTIKENSFEVIVFDTLNSAHSKEENSASEMRQVNRKLLDLINDTNATILYLHHHRKPQKGENYGQSSSRGSTEILAKVASHLLLDSRNITIFDSETKEAFAGLHLTITQFKSRLTDKLQTFGVDVWHKKETNQTIWRYTGVEDEGKTKLDTAMGFIISTIKEREEWNIADLMEERIREKLNFGENNLREALKELVKTNKILSKTGKQGKKLYFLPENGQKAC